MTPFCARLPPTCWPLRYGRVQTPHIGQKPELPEESAQLEQLDIPGWKRSKFQRCPIDDDAWNGPSSMALRLASTEGDPARRSGCASPTCGLIDAPRPAARHQWPDAQHGVEHVFCCTHTTGRRQAQTYTPTQTRPSIPTGSTILQKQDSQKLPSVYQLSAALVKILIHSPETKNQKPLKKPRNRHHHRRVPFPFPLFSLGSLSSLRACKKSSWKQTPKRSEPVEMHQARQPLPSSLPVSAFPPCLSPLSPPHSNRRYGSGVVDREPAFRWHVLGVSRCCHRPRLVRL